MEALILDLTDDQIVKPDCADISERLHDLALEVSSLSETQPDFPKRIKRIQKELRWIDGVLRSR